MPQLTIDLNDLGIDVDDAAGWVEAVDAFGNPMPVAAGAGSMVFGARALDFDASGVAVINLPSTSSLTPVGACYRVFLTRADAATRPVAVGPFVFTAAANLRDVAELPPADAVAAALAALAAEFDVYAASSAAASQSSAASATSAAASASAAEEIAASGTPGPAGEPGPPGADGIGVPAGGASGQVLAKASEADHDVVWVDQSVGGGGDFDTDFRDVSEWFPGWTFPAAGRPTIRRIGPAVYFDFDSANNPGYAIADFPAGFRPGRQINTRQYGLGGTYVEFYPQSETAYYVDSPAGSGRSLHLVWLTDDAEPSSLPGTPL